LELQKKAPSALQASPPIGGDNKNVPPHVEGWGEYIETKIDLDIDIFIPDSFFSSELDKINFYREIELINNLEDLKEIKKDFFQTNLNIPESTENLFNLLELKLLSSKYYITNIKKV